jgi:hypothetical protein
VEHPRGDKDCANSSVALPKKNNTKKRYTAESERRGEKEERSGT